MSIKAGTADVKKIYAGSTPVKAVYAGDTQVWPVGGGVNPQPDAAIHRQSMLISRFTVPFQPPLLNGNTQELTFGNTGFVQNNGDLHINALFYTNSLNNVHKGLYTGTGPKPNQTVENALICAKQYSNAWRWSLGYHVMKAGNEGGRNYYTSVPSIDGFWATNFLSWGIMFPADKLPWEPKYNTYDLAYNWTNNSYGDCNVNSGVPNSWAIFALIAMSQKDRNCVINNAVYVSPKQTAPDNNNSPYDCLIGYGYAPIGADGKASLRAEDYLETYGAGGAMLVIWEKA